MRHMFAKNPYSKFMSKNRWDIIQTLTGMFVFIVIIITLALIVFGVYAILYTLKKPSPVLAIPGTANRTEPIYQQINNTTSARHKSTSIGHFYTQKGANIMRKPNGYGSIVKLSEKEESHMLSE